MRIQRVVILLCVLSLFVGGCSFAPPGKPRKIKVLTTGYCDCKKCTGWKRNWLFQAVYAYGPNKGKRKKVGVTSDGSKAEKGVAASTLKNFPYGTVFKIPGYGYAEVHDTGKALKDYQIDLYFSSHRKAREWGRQELEVLVWYPKESQR